MKYKYRWQAKLLCQQRGLKVIVFSDRMKIEQQITHQVGQFDRICLLRRKNEFLKERICLENNNAE